MSRMNRLSKLCFFLLIISMFLAFGSVAASQQGTQRHILDLVFTTVDLKFHVQDIE